MKAYIHYTFDANQIILDTITNHGITDEKVIKILSHTILNTRNFINKLALKEVSEEDTFRITPTNELVRINQQNKEALLNIIAERDLHEMIPYFTPQGHDFSNCLHDMIHHFLFHAAHHRGQISMLLSDKVKLPLEINYIAYAGKYRAQHLQKLQTN